jgi:hypothetical protein
MPNGAVLTVVDAGAITWPVDTDGLLYINFTIPPGATAITARITLSPITAGEDPRLRIGELTATSVQSPTLYPPVKRPNYGALLQV